MILNQGNVVYVMILIMGRKWKYEYWYYDYDCDSWYDDDINHSYKTRMIIMIIMINKTIQLFI